MVGPGLITFSQQILVSKLLLVLNYDHHLKLCIKKKNKKPAQEDYEWNNEF